MVPQNIINIFFNNLIQQKHTVGDRGLSIDLKLTIKHTNMHPRTGAACKPLLRYHQEIIKKKEKRSRWKKRDP